MRAWVASSLSTNPAEAILDVGARLRVLGAPSATGRPHSGAALCFVGAQLAHEGKAMHDALGEMSANIKRKAEGLHS